MAKLELTTAEMQALREAVVFADLEHPDAREGDTLAVWHKVMQKVEDALMLELHGDS